MNFKLSYVALGAIIAAALPFLAGAALNLRPVNSAPSTVALAAADTPDLRQIQLTSSGVFAQYDSPAPQVYDLVLPVSDQTSNSLTVGGAPVTGTGPSTLSPAPSNISADVDAGVTNMNKALATAPVAMARMTESIARNGVIAALAYDDPAVKAQTDQLGVQIGASLRGFADAIAKDMQRSIRESGIQQQSAGR